jgi:ketosteroid isomerase-like protein
VADEADELRTIEQERLAAFVAADVPTLQRLHANDFQLVNPAGQELNRDDYLNGIAEGFITYRRWEPEGRIQAYVFGEVAILRYRSTVEVSVQGEAQPEQRFWQVEVYEKRRDGWQATFSQSTRISL